MKELNIFNSKKYNIKKIVYIFISLGIAYLLISNNDIMWAKDRFYYLRYAEYSGIIIQNNFSQGVLKFLSNEPLFLILNYILAFFFSPENVLKTIIFFSTFLMLYSLGRMSNYNLWVLFLFLCSPTMLHKYITQIRQGLAMSVYFFGLAGYLENKKFKNIRFLTPLIHSSLAFILLFEVFELFLKKTKVNLNLRLIFSIAGFSGFILLIPNIATIIGDRRADLYVSELGSSGSGLGFLIWILAGSYFIIFKQKKYISIICNYGIIFYLVSYFYLDYGARIFESIFPLIVLSAATDNRRWFKVTYIAFLILYAMVGWYERGGLNF